MLAGYCALGWIIDGAHAGARKAATLRTVLAIGEHRCRGVRVDLNWQCLRWGRNHRRGRHVGLRTDKDELLDGCDLLAIVEFLELDKLRFHVLNECNTLGTLQLSKEFLWKMVRM